jgi:hypothetical protein
LIEDKHTKAVTVISTNGTLVATGDAYRYFYVWDGASHEE